jgi:hypothetical protein
VQEEHRLIVRSVLDLDCSCSCGRWSMMRTTTTRDVRETILQEAKDEHARHVARQDARIANAMQTARGPQRLAPPKP